MELSSTATAVQIDAVATIGPIFQVNKPPFSSSEYLPIENREPLGFESDMPRGGLAIWHIDEAKASNFIYNNDQGFPGQVGWPENNQHDTVALLQADGQYGLERGYNRGDAGDVYAKSSKKSPAPTLGPGRLDPKVYPNTDTYRGGVVYQTDVKFSNVSEGGTTMYFGFNCP